MGRKQPHSIGHLVVTGDWVLLGSYAGSPFDWFIAQVVYADPKLDEVVLHRTEATGSDPYLLVVDRGLIRARSHPSAMAAAAEGSELAAAVPELLSFKRQAEAAWGRLDTAIADAERALAAARDAKWRSLDSLYQTDAAEAASPTPEPEGVD